MRRKKQLESADRTDLETSTSSNKLKSDSETNSPPRCAICMYPSSLYGQRLDILPLTNFTCSLPKVDILPIKYKSTKRSKQKLEEIENLHKTRFSRRAPIPGAHLQAVGNFNDNDPKYYIWQDDYHLAQSIFSQHDNIRIFMQIQSRDTVFMACNITRFPVTDVLYYENENYSNNNGNDKNVKTYKPMEFLGRYEVPFECDVLPWDLELPSGKTLGERLGVDDLGSISDLNKKGFVTGSSFDLVARKWPPSTPRSHAAGDTVRSKILLRLPQFGHFWRF